MPSTPLRVALIGGSSSDPLYDRLPEIEGRIGCKIDVLVKESHPELNEAIRLVGRAGPLPFDLISTHIKYAPSQAEWLLPLDDLVSATELAPFTPGLLEHCRFQGRLLQLPRLFDARLMHYRSDLVPQTAIPATWTELGDLAATLTNDDRSGFAFPGRSSGLFGTFFELLVMNGGTLLDEENRPAFDSEFGSATLAWMHDLYAVRKALPRELPQMQFDSVSEAFRDGRVAMVGDWPGFFGLHRDPATSVASTTFAIERYPVGSAGIRKAYSGCHSFAITASSRDIPASLALLHELTSFGSQLSEARQGAFPVRSDVLSAVREIAQDDALALLQLDLLDATITEGDALTFPQLACYPEIEDAVWPLLQAAVTGERSVQKSLSDAANRVSTILGGQ